MLRLLPVENPRELVQFRMEGGRVGSQNGDGLHTFSYPMYVAFRDRNTVFSGLTGQYTDRLSLLAGDRGEMVEAGWVAANFFQVLGVKPFIGRVLTAEDDRPEGGAAVVVLQYAFWQSRYAGRQDVLARRSAQWGAELVGVAAPEFGGTNAGILTQLWAPVTSRTALSPTWQEDLKNERYAWFYLSARLKPDVTLPQAEAAMRVLHDQRKQEELQGEFFAKFPDTRDRFLRQTLNLIPADRGLSSLRRTFEAIVVLQWLVGGVCSSSARTWRGCSWSGPRRATRGCDPQRPGPAESDGAELFIEGHSRDRRGPPRAGHQNMVTRGLVRSCPTTGCALVVDALMPSLLLTMRTLGSGRSG